MSAHTPGPWDFSKGWALYRCSSTEKGKSGFYLEVGKNANSNLCKYDNEWMANARLAQVAPDYDAMARHLESWWRLPGAERTIEAIEPVIREALDAIAKAEGRA